MATIRNARDVLLQAAVSRLDTVPGPTNVTVDFAQVNGATKPSNNADVTTNILTNSGTSIVMNNANLFKSGSGAGGVFIGSGGLFGKDAGGTETFAIDAGTGAVRFRGDISGGSNIAITGLASFGGAYSSGGYVSAVVANSSYAATTGVLAYGNGDAAVRGDGRTNSDGVIGSTDGSGKAGIYARGGHPSGYGGIIINDGGGTGLLVDTGSYSGSAYAIDCYGRFNLSNHSFSWNGYSFAAPTGSSTTCFHNDGVWRDPVTTARVNAAFGATESEVCQIVVTDSGTATVAGSGINLNCTVAGVQTVGSGNTVVIRSISDERLKQDIQDETLGLDFILGLRSRTYRMRRNPALRYHGFIYQEVAKQLRLEGDSLAQHRAGGYGGVDYMSLLAPLVLAVQQLAARIEQLEKRQA